MAQQERVAKTRRNTDEKFAAILEAAIAKVKRGEVEVDPADRAKWLEGTELSEDDMELPMAVRTLRDAQGMAWWLIGQTLGLPGAGDSAVTGKGGASFARKLYSRGFGAVPRTIRERKTPVRREVNEDRQALAVTPKGERVAMVRAGKPAIRPDMTNEEIEKMLAGRTILWSINLNDIDGKGDQFYEQSATVHQELIWVRHEGDKRTVVFYEQGNAKNPKHRGKAGAVREVRLRSIHSVR